jgi:hypothetical protein
MNTRRPRDGHDPTSPQLLNFHPQQQTTLPLIQMRTQHGIPGRRQLRDFRTTSHSTTVETPDQKPKLFHRKS